jgi:hypothetical protein
MKKLLLSFLLFPLLVLSQVMQHPDNATIAYIQKASVPPGRLRVSANGVKNGMATIVNNGFPFGIDTPGTTTVGLQEAWNYSQSAGSNGPVVNGITIELGDEYYFFTNQIVLWQTNVASAHIVGSSLLSTKLVYAGTNSGISTILYTNSYTDDLGFSIAGHLFVENIGFSAINDYMPLVLFEVRNLGGGSFQNLNFTGWQIMTNQELGDGASVSIASVPTLYPPGAVGLWINTGGGDHGIILDNIYLAGLADGVVAWCDHITSRGIRSAWLGGIGAIGGTNAWPQTHVFSLGAAVIDSVNLDGTFDYLHLYRTLAGVVKYSGYAADTTAFGGSTTYSHVNCENCVYPMATDGGNNGRIVFRDPSDDSLSVTALSPIYISITNIGAGATYVSNKFTLMTGTPYNDAVVYGNAASLRSSRQFFVGNGKTYALDIFTNWNLTLGMGTITNKASNVWTTAALRLTNHMNGIDIVYDNIAQFINFIDTQPVDTNVAQICQIYNANSGGPLFFAQSFQGNGHALTNLSSAQMFDNVVTETSNYTLTDSDSTVLVNSTTLTMTLPSAVGRTGRRFTIVLIASSTATVNTTSSQNINGRRTYTLSAQYKYVTVMSDGTQWYVVANN